MVSTRPPTSKSSRPFNNPFVTVPKTPITIGTIVTIIIIIIIIMFGTFSVLWKSPSISWPFHFLLLLIYSRPGRQNLFDD